MQNIGEPEPGGPRILRVKSTDRAETVALEAVAILTSGEVLELTNNDNWTLKTIATAEIVKRSFADRRTTLYQYNKLDVREQIHKTAGVDTVELGQPQLAFRIPDLRIRFHTAPLSNQDGWTEQRHIY